MMHLENQFNVKINEYVIMPDHLHMIIEFYDFNNMKNQRADARPAPTLGDVICAFKTNTSSVTKRNIIKFVNISNKIH